MPVAITQQRDFEPPAIHALASVASSEGHRFVKRTLEEWSDGSNRFDQPGEAFYIASDGGRVIGMCGLNIDPYLATGEVGRLRHLYVTPAHRRLGVGTALVDTCLNHAGRAFARVRLRTFDRDASRFYLSMGFVLIDESDSTHSMEMARPQPAGCGSDRLHSGLRRQW
jgi:GNAT superfamily N-acetyltransferase